MQNKDLHYFMNLKYNVLMRKYNKAYYAFIHELSLFTEGETVSEAYENLEKEKLIYFKRMLAIDATCMIKEPLPITVRKNLQESLLLFTAKTVIIGIMLGAIVSLFLPALDVFISTRIDPILSLGIIMRKTDDKLSNMSEKDLEEKKNMLKRIVLKTKPFADEFKVLLKDDPRSTKQVLEKKTSP